MLAAGYDLRQIEAFDAAIHVHGADPLWLAEHLTLTFNDPTSLGADGQDLLTYKGDVGAWLDPALMLQLATGYVPATGKIPRPLDDSASELHARLQALYLKEYAAGRNDDSLMEQWFGLSSGIEPDGENALVTNGSEGHRRSTSPVTVTSWRCTTPGASSNG